MKILQYMPRWLKIIGVILLSVALFFAWAYWPERARLDHLADAGDPYDATIIRDSYGVPHIFGPTDADVAYGLAYAHAEDDFLTIQQSLIAARGDLGAVYGLDAAPNDYMVALLRIWEFVDAGYEQEVAAETRAVAEGYAAGLNHYAALHENEAIPNVFPVNGKDVIAGFVHKTPLFFGIDGILGELFAEERRRDVSPGPADTTDRLPMPEWTYYGSNAIAVGPSRTADGETFLAVNSHQPWSGPVTWYEAHVQSDAGWHAAGGLFPGAPVILHGHNDNLGWSFTVNSPDVADVFVLEINPDNPDQYRFDGEWLELEVRQAPIKVKLFGRFRWTVKREVLWSVYGPAVRQPHGTYAVRFASMGDLRLIEQWHKMNRAETFDQWYDAMANGPLPMFNAGYADKEGNIFYVYNGRLPLRTEGYNWEQYLPGDSSATLWNDYLPFAELPQVLNPPAGFIQNANNSPFQTTIGEGNPIQSDFSATFGIEDHMSNRALRTLELFGSDDEITWEEFVAYKYDYCYSPDSDVPHFVNVILDKANDDTSERSAALTLLAEWDLCADADSMAATIGILSMYFMSERDGVRFNASRINGSTVGDADLVAGFEAAVDHLIEHFGTVEIQWGEINRLRRGDVDLPLSGSPDQLHAVYAGFEEDGRLVGFNGDSYIMLVRWDSSGQVSSWSIHQFGSATLNEASPHYNDQSHLFARRELKPMWFSEEAVRANALAVYRPGEE